MKIVGYGSADLVERLRAATWTPCYPDGENFPIGIRGQCLCRPADRLCSAAFTITLQNVQTGQAFTVSGFSYPGFLIGYDRDSSRKNEPNTILNELFVHAPGLHHPYEYEMEIS